MHYVYTNYTGGNTGDKASGYTVGKTEMLFLIDRETDAAYYLRIDSTSKISIIKRRAYLKSVSLLEHPVNQKALVDTIEKTINVAFYSTSYLNYYFDTDDNCLYIISPQNPTLEPNQEVLITKIHALDWNITQQRITNT